MTRLEELSGDFLDGKIDAKTYRSCIVAHLSSQQIRKVSKMETDEETRVFAINHAPSATKD